MSLHIVTVATQSQYYFPYLLKSCERNGVTLEVLGLGEEWQGFNWKYKKMIEYLKSIPKNDLVCFVDGYDVICCRDLKEMPTVFYNLKKQYNCRLIFAEDKTISVLMNLNSLYFGKCNGQKINSGTYIGLSSDLLYAITKIHDLDPRDDADDQILVVDYCNKNPNEIYCDTQNQLFLTLGNSLQELDRYVTINEKTKKLTYQSNEPFFIHAPGYGYLDNIIRKLGYSIEENKIKNELFYNFIEKKVWLYTKMIVNQYFYTILLVIIFITSISVVVIYVYLRKYYKVKIIRLKT
jgi:hypothetical protein